MVKTDFKNTYEAFMHCDKNKLAKEFAAMYSDNEEQAAAVKEVDRAFARMETVTPKAVNPDEQSIIVVCKGFGDEGDDTVCIEVEDLRKWREEHLKESEPISDEMLTFMSTDEIENAVMKQDLPTKYAFELSAWNEILSWKLAPSSIYIYTIAWEDDSLWKIILYLLEVMCGNPYDAERTIYEYLSCTRKQRALFEWLWNQTVTEVNIDYTEPYRYQHIVITHNNPFGRYYSYDLDELRPGHDKTLYIFGHIPHSEIVRFDRDCSGCTYLDIDTSPNSVGVIKLSDYL